MVRQQPTSFTTMLDESFDHHQPNAQRHIQASFWDNFISAPTFDGNVFRTPAPEFIEDFQNYLELHATNHSPTEEMKCVLFLARLTNDAEVWAKVFGRRHRSFESLKAAFLRRFWGQDVQWRIRDEFAYGSYRQIGEVSKMGKYFAGIFRRVSNLSSPPSDEEFIFTISAHFPFYLQQQLNRLSSVEDAYLLLIKRDRALNYSAQLYKLRQQRQSELEQQRQIDLDNAAPSQSEGFCDEHCAGGENVEPSENSTSRSTDSPDAQPRSLGGGAVTVKTPSTVKPLLVFNPGQQLSQSLNTLSESDETEWFDYHDGLDALGSAERQSVLNDDAYG